MTKEVKPWVEYLIPNCDSSDLADQFVSSKICQQWTNSYSDDDALKRVPHSSNYLSVVMKLKLRELYLNGLSHPSFYDLDLDNAVLDGFAIKVTRNSDGVNRVFGLDGIAGVSGTFPTEPDKTHPYIKRTVIDFGMKNCSAKLLRTTDGEVNKLFDGEAGITFDLTFRAWIEKDEAIFNIYDFSSSCSDKSLTFEIVGFRMRIPYIDLFPFGEKQD